jgi:NAD(P)-dependent dehydrogenase (short-subunit alcohol dehydrogenase family)
MRAGRWPYAGGNVYGATKAFVRQFSLNLRADLIGTALRVTDIEPGLCGGTEFSNVRFHGDDDKAAKVYADVQPLTAEGHRRFGVLDRHPPGACEHQHHRADAGGTVLRRPVAAARLRARCSGAARPRLAVSLRRTCPRSRGAFAGKSHRRGLVGAAEAANPCVRPAPSSRAAYRA